MINSALATSGPILDAAYLRLGLPATHGITREQIAAEIAELALYDFAFASNPEVEKSLEALGYGPDRILRTTFGWNPSRFERVGSIARTTFRAVFVGRIGVRKGVPDLLEAWESAAVDGELLLVGSVDAEIADLVDRHVRTGRVRLHGYADNPATVYGGSDVFIFPTLEEGGHRSPTRRPAAACQSSPPRWAQRGWSSTGARGSSSTLPRLTSSRTRSSCSRRMKERAERMARQPSGLAPISPTAWSARAAPTCSRTRWGDVPESAPPNAALHCGMQTGPGAWCSGAGVAGGQLAAAIDSPLSAKVLLIQVTGTPRFTGPYSCSRPKTLFWTVMPLTTYPPPLMMYTVNPPPDR